MLSTLFICVFPIDTLVCRQTSLMTIDYSRSFLGNSMRLYIHGCKAFLALLDHYRVHNRLPSFETPCKDADTVAQYFTVPTEQELHESEIRLSDATDLQRFLSGKVS